LFEPLFYLLAFGIGLSALVGDIAYLGVFALIFFPLAIIKMHNRLIK
jgi:hypothetical protein